MQGHISPEIGTLTLSVIPRKGHKGTGTGSVGNSMQRVAVESLTTVVNVKAEVLKERQTSTTQGMNVRPVFVARSLQEKSRAGAGGSTL